MLKLCVYDVYHESEMLYVYGITSVVWLSFIASFLTTITIT